MIHVGYDITDTLYPCFLDETDRTVWFRSEPFVNFCRDFGIKIQIDKTDHHISVVDMDTTKERVLKRIWDNGEELYHVLEWDFSMFIFKAKMMTLS